LLKYGPFEAPGFLIGFLSGRYNPDAGNIQLFVRVVFAGKKKLGALLKDNVDVPGSFDCDVYDAKDLPRQLAAIMPNRILELRSDGDVRKFHRMREPWHSVYLIWAAQDALSCRVFTNDIAVDGHGRLFICRNIHQDRRESTPTFAESTLVGSTPEEMAEACSSMVPAYR
jgi:hypothetical protein